MPAIPDNVRQDLVTLVPASLLNEISCFAFYDNHPRDVNQLDIIICTNRGEVREYSRRELVFSAIIDRCSKPSDIILLRNSKCELFYLVAFADEVAVLSRRTKLEIAQRIDNVESFDVEDVACCGQARLKIICKDDAVPLVFDDNFERLEDHDFMNKTKEDDSLPILTQLARKLTEARYSVKCNEKVYKDLVALRQAVSYDAKLIRSLTGSSTIKHDQTAVLRCKSMQPFIYKCMKKLVIGIDVANNGLIPAEEIHYLLHSTTEPSIVYSTKIFCSTSDSPYWKEALSINPEISAYVILVTNLEEHKYSLSGRLDLGGVISYKSDKQEKFLNLPKIGLSATDMMSEESDISKLNSNKLYLLSMLAATEKIDLCIRHIKNNEADVPSLLDLFQEYLNMERIKDNDGENMNALYRNSPLNILHGVIIFEKEMIDSNTWIISLYTRKPSQILAFIHFVHDSIPHRLVITTAEQKITSKLPELTIYDEDITCEPKRINYSGLHESVAKQTALTLEYFDESSSSVFDECMMKMNENKDLVVQNKIGTEIDVFAGDIAVFKDKVLLEMETGVRRIRGEESQEIDEGMVIDLD